MLELKIASPCDQSWTAMKGDEQVRHCKRCDHNVYNISEMTEKEVEELIRRTEGKFCARIYRRTDNRVMTKDCPRGVARVRRRIAVGATMAFAATLMVVKPLFAPSLEKSTLRTQRLAEPAEAIEASDAFAIEPSEGVTIGKLAVPEWKLKPAPVEKLHLRMGRVISSPKDLQ